MARKSRKEREEQRTRRKYVPWESDSAKPSLPSSQEVLMSWFAMPGNVERWRRQKHTELVKEIVRLMQSHGIRHREATDVHHKMQTLSNGFASAVAHLGLKGQEEAFDRGEADAQTVEEVNKICPHYQQLLPIFRTSPTGKKAQMLATNTGAAKSSGVAAGGMNSAAGKWKESLEKDRGKAAAGEVGGSKAKPADKGTEGNPSATGKKGGQEQRAAAVESNGKQSTVQAEESNTSDAGKQVVVEEEQEGVLANVGAAGEGKQTSADKKSSVSVPEEAPASDDSDSDSSDEEQADPVVSDKNAGQEKQHQAGETSSSEEADSDDAKEESESEEEVDDGEERIPLAQPDEETEEEVKEEPAEHNELDVDDSEASGGEGEAGGEGQDQDQPEQVEDSEGEEEEEEPDNRAPEASSEDSDSSSSDSESEGADNETEDPPTSAKADSEQHEAQADNADDEEEMEGEEPPTQKAAEQSDSASEAPAPERKRRSFVESRPPSAKRARRDASDVTRDLQRAAFIEQAKQEQAQREELFQLERSKLECELAAKQVQLAMDKALARRTLLGAGIDPAEVDRVLQL
jgi:hypothetical protein